MDSMATYKKSHAGFTSPNFATQHDFELDPKGARMHVELPLLSFRDRQILATQDPLASAHHFHVITRVVVPALFGVRT
eukprot:1039436-Karenia_brevis.AAC.1